MFSNRLRFPAALSMGGLFLFAAVASAGNWERFRGPNGAGVVDDKLPVAWAKQHVLWKVKLPGEGHSSPVIWKDKLLIQTADKDATKRIIMCLNAKNGKVNWQQTMPGQKDHKNKKNSFASSTVATDGENVFASIWDGKNVHIGAWCIHGKGLVWKRDLGPFKSQHGPAASPIVYKDKVIFFNDQDFKSKLLALDAASGKIVWETPRPAFRACYGIPFLWEREKGKKELVVISTLEFTGYNPDTGKSNWQWKWKHWAKRPLRVTGSPVFAGNMVYGASGDGGGDRYTVAVSINGMADKVKGKLMWSDKRDFPYVPSMLAYKGNIFFTNDYGVCGCYNAKTGKKNWLERISDVPFTASPIIADGKIYAANEEGDVFVIGAAPKLQVLARNSLGERIRATPAVANGRLYVRGRNHLFCIGETE